MSRLRLLGFLCFLVLITVNGKAEIIYYGHPSLHLYFTLNTETKEAVLGGEDFGSEGNALYYPPIGDKWWDTQENLWADIAIPETIIYKNEPYVVVGVAANAFLKKTRIRKISLPETVTYIGPNAFSWCVNLKQINIPSKVTEIAASTFFLCQQLENIVLPHGIKRILDSAFGECWKLKKISIPGTCTYIGNDAFAWCSSLSNIVLEDGDEPLTCGHNYALSLNYQGPDRPRHRGLFADVPADTVYIGRDLLVNVTEWGEVYKPFLTFHDYPNSIEGDIHLSTGKSFDEVRFGDKVTTITDSLFWESTIRNEVILPPKLKHIGKRSFSSSLGQAYLTIPDSVSFIGEYAFEKCGINVLKILGPCENWETGTFDRCAPIWLIIGEAVKVIPRFYFSDLRYIECLPQTPPFAVNQFGVTPIIVADGAGSTYRDQWPDAIIVDKLDEVVTVNVKTPGSFYSRLLAQDYQLDNVYKLKLKGSINDVDLEALSSMNKVYSYDFSELEMEELPSGFFQGMSKLFHITLPQSLTKINIDEFRDCIRLEGTMTIPSSCAEIGDYAFANTNINQLSCLGSINIGFKAFDGCRKLNSVYFKDSIIVEKYAFNSSNIASVSIPTGSVLKDNAFKGSNLINVTFADGVKHIGENALDESLVSIKFNGMIGKIDYQTYPNLREILVSDIETWCQLPFPDTEIMKQVPQLYIGDELVENITIPENIQIRDYVFYNCSTLKSIEFPLGLSVMPKGILKNCTNLSAVKIPNTVSTIDAEALYGCRTLNSLSLPSSIRGIGNYAFYNCEQLQNIEFPAELVAIGEGAFAGCTSLESLKFPISVNSIGASAFAGCSELQEIRAQWREPFLINENTFNNVASDCYLYIPVMCAGKYLNAGWNVPNLKEAGVLFVSAKGEGEILYNENVVRSQSKEFLFSPYKSFYITFTPDEGYAIRKIKLNGENVLNMVDEGKVFIEEPEEDFAVEIVFADPEIEDGDVNSDYAVNTTDAISIMSYILKHAPSNFYDYLADVNDDGVINVTDVLLVVSCFLKTK